MTTLKFSKMHGLGNDFVVIDAINQDVTLNSVQIANIADRNFGIGCDQLLLVEPAQDAAFDFYYRIYNSDGSEAQQCGNGARCFYKFIQQENLSNKAKLNVQMLNGSMQLEQAENELVRVSMNTPNFDPASIPFEATQENKSYALALKNATIEIGAVSMGNPHAVTLVNHIDSLRVSEQGPLIESHDRFPEKVNAGFMQILNRGEINLRVYERGAGETLACGSGACAAMAVGHQWGLLNDTVTVHLPGGALTIEWQGGDAPLYMTGPANFVFAGEITI